LGDEKSNNSTVQKALITPLICGSSEKPKGVERPIMKLSSPLIMAFLLHPILEAKRLKYSHSM